MQSVLDDLRFATRRLVRRPALLAVTTIALSLGISANAIMFGVVDQLLIQPPAGIAAPDQVKRIFYRDMEGAEARVGQVTTYPVIAAIRAHAPAFSDVAAFGFKGNWSLGTGRDASNAVVQMVSGNYFRVLGVQAVMGRTLLDDDDRIPRGEMVAVVSYDFWTSTLAGASDVVGRTLRLQDKLFTVVGVAPRGFAGVDRERVDVWVPIAAVAADILGKGWYDTPNNWWATAIGRLRGDATPELAAEQATAAYRGLAREWKDAFRDSTSTVVLSTLVGARTPNGVSAEGKISLWLMGVSAIVLLIACANVANLLIAHTLQRRREIAVRLALGVSRGRLARLLMSEAVMLATIAATVAIAITFWAGQLVQRVLLPFVVWHESIIDARALGFTLLAAVICILLSGAAPALEGASTPVSEGLKSSARQVTAGRGRLRFALMTAQAALSIVLLIGAGLFVSSLRNVVTRDVGLDRDRVLQVLVPLKRFGFSDARAEDIFRRARERTQAIPGVASATIVRLSAPLYNLNASGFAVPGVPRRRLQGGGPYNAVVGADFFSTVGASMLRGRPFTTTEERSASRVAIVNESLAKAYWPDGDPVGACVHVFRDSTCTVVVGVSHNVVQFSLTGDVQAIVYVPPSHPALPPAPPLAMLVRVARDPATVVPLVRRELQQLDPNMPYVQVSPYSDLELVRRQLQPWRLGASMFTLFGIVALVIAAVGLYSVMSFWVSQRTQEIGVRMALGAQRADVVRLVAWQSSRAVLAGLVLGAAAAALASRWIAPMLYDISPRSPTVYAGAAMILALAAAVASVVPARRSAAIDPALAIRSD